MIDPNCIIFLQFNPFKTISSLFVIFCSVFEPSFNCPFPESHQSIDAGSITVVLPLSTEMANSQRIDEVHRI
jgi:hypothetical protein